jgi:hypothetical protein
VDKDSVGSSVVEGLLRNLQQNLHDDINARFNRLLPRSGGGKREVLIFKKKGGGMEALQRGKVGQQQ